MKKYLGFTLAITIFLGFFIGTASIAAEKPISIGLLVPITGTQAVMGEDLLTGAKMAVEETNRAGGVLGRPLKLIVEDTETRPAPGMDAARKLIGVDKVRILTGGFSSGVSLPIAKYAQEQGVLYLLAVPTSPLFRGVGPYCMSITVVDSFKGKAIADFAVDDSGKKKFALMHMNNAFGQALKQVTINRLKELGAEIVTEVDYELNKVDYKAELQRLYAKDPEAIIGTWYAKEGLVTAKQAYEMGLLNVDKVPWYVPEITSSYAEALQKIPTVLEGIKGLDPLEPKELFSEKFKKKVGREPITAFAAQYYDAVRMIAMAINFAHSTDPAAVRDALFEIDDWYRGVSYGGDKRFDTDGMQDHAAFRKLIIKTGKKVDYFGE
jgi:branched-chain amino acid transport system substrate-binding protein